MMLFELQFLFSILFQVISHTYVFSGHCISQFIHSLSISFQVIVKFWFDNKLMFLKCSEITGGLNHFLQFGQICIMSLSSIKLYSKLPMRHAHRSMGLSRANEHPELSQGH